MRLEALLHLEVKLQIALLKAVKLKNPHYLAKYLLALHLKDFQAVQQLNLIHAMILKAIAKALVRQQNLVQANTHNFLDGLARCLKARAQEVGLFIQQLDICNQLLLKSLRK